MRPLRVSSFVLKAVTSNAFAVAVALTRWPLRFSAYPLLHQVWGLNHLGRC